MIITSGRNIELGGAQKACHKLGIGTLEAKDKAAQCLCSINSRTPQATPIEYS